MRLPAFTLIATALGVFALSAPALQGAESLLAKFQSGPMSGVEDIIFAERKYNETDGHWYANLGYYANDPNRKAWREGGRLYRWNIASGKLTALIDDPHGGVRDPQVHYDGKKVIFSYRKGGTEQYHLYEINADGTGLRQLTEGQYDEFEPTYLPSGDLVFISTRCKRWVNCWMTQVGVLHRSDANGQNIRPLSSNNEQDNTPWPLHDGRILYTRWEYIDRSQVDYHHLWAAYPDGTSQMIWYGNQHPSTVMIDAKPIPASDKVIAIFSPGHGMTEHAGPISIVDPSAGPDDSAFARRISRGDHLRDPWAFSENAFMAAERGSLVLLDSTGAQETIFKLPDAEVQSGMLLHEPRPLVSRPRETIIPDRTDAHLATGSVILSDIYDGRNMAGVKRGEIKKLLVMEPLPAPIHFTGGMEPISYGGTFLLERIVGTVPVEPDGSAHVELPAMRSFFFVALDENDLAIKRMQSFFTLQPGETTSCVGCHEQRTRTPAITTTTPLAAKRPASHVAPIAGVPEIIDFPRDIQPVLDALCVKCHGYEKNTNGGPRAGRLLLAGDHGPMYSQSYYMLTISGLFSDNRNQPRSNFAPRTLGSSASRILRMLDGSHHAVQATETQKRLLRLWIDAGAPYPGTYAALANGMIGSYIENEIQNIDQSWPATQPATAVVDSRCAGCHNEPSRLLPRTICDERGVSFWQPTMGDPRLNTSRHIVFNLSQPEKSILLLAPLSEKAGGWGLCRDPKTKQPVTVFADTADPDYQKLLAMCSAGRDYLNQVKRFDMPGFRPRTDWVREMKRYGILPQTLGTNDPIDVYATEEQYWQSLWHHPHQTALK